MDGDRSMADRRDIFESKLQGFVREAFWHGRESHEIPSLTWIEQTLNGYNGRVHELLISYLDGPTSDVGAPDEASEA